MNKKLKRLLLTLGLLIVGSPVLADPITMLDGFQVSAGKVGLRSDSIELRSSGGTGIATLVFAGSINSNRTLTLPDPGANGDFLMTQGTQSVAGAKTFAASMLKLGGAGSGVATFLYANSSNSRSYTVPDSGGAAEFVMNAGNQTIAGVKTFSSAPTITGGLTAANIQTGSAKRQVAVWAVNGAAGSVIADGATYKGFIPFGRAGVVKRVNCLCGTAPVGGTSTIKVLEATSSGNTMLSAASLDPTTLADNVITSPSLTATAADLTLTATQGVYVEWVAGTQSTDGVNCSIAVEYEPDDF